MNPFDFLYCMCYEVSIRKSRGLLLGAPWASVYFVIIVLIYFFCGQFIYGELHGRMYRSNTPAIILITMPICLGILVHCYYVYYKTIIIMFRYRRMGNLRVYLSVLLFYAPLILALLTPLLIAKGYIPTLPYNPYGIREL